MAQEIGARCYKECSALRTTGVDDVFEAATRASMLVRGEGAGSGRDKRKPPRDDDDGNDGPD